MIQPKYKDLLNGYKNKTHIYAVYKKSTQPTQERKLQAKNTYRLKVRGWKINSMEMESKRTQE